MTALKGHNIQMYEYRIINPTTSYKNEKECIDAYAEEGWRFVVVIPPPVSSKFGTSGYVNSLVFERIKPVESLSETIVKQAKPSLQTVGQLIDMLCQYSETKKYSLLVTREGKHSYLIIGDDNENAILLT